MLRDYQGDLAIKAADILLRLHIVYLAMEMRVGKTLIALKAAELTGAKKVIFITKKKAISSIVGDYEREGFEFELTVINYEQAGKYKPEYDTIIVDEAHSLGAYPKPTGRTKNIAKLVLNHNLILASGTPTPESYSQIFHQFAISTHTPFQYGNFYRWAEHFVAKSEKWISGRKINDYSHANSGMIDDIIRPYMLTYTRDQAGFNIAEVTEQVVTVPLDPRLKQLIDILLKDKYYRMRNGAEIICDSAVKLQTKVHQICSGTVKTEDDAALILSMDKAHYIRDSYHGKKIAIFYKFIAEGAALKSVIQNWTEDPVEFNLSSDMTFISQIQSGSMGVNLATADILIFYNIDFSAVQYWQARARIQDMNRNKIPLVHWLFTDGGIEHKIYEVVQKKRDYTNRYFKSDYLKVNTKQLIV